jgi:DNA processing protein
VAVIRRGEARYPQQLNELQSPPDPLFAIGDLSIVGAGRRLVSIVGTRDASPYGVRVAAELAKAFVEAGAVVVSGLARGIDSAAHRGALEARGKTVAVLGTGVDVPYPAGNRGLHAEVGVSGLVVSEHEPGTPAGPGCFPRRNRIIAALAEMTVVVEAPYKSGAVNTATQALELGRTVAAIPGPIDSPRSAGSNLLLRDGAQFIATVDDALSLMGLSRKVTARAPELEYLENRVYEAVGAGAGSADALAFRLGLAVRQVIETIGTLELKGLVRVTPDGQVCPSGPFPALGR